LDSLAHWRANVSMPEALGAKRSFNLEKICVTPPEQDRCITVIFRTPYIKETAGTINCDGDVKKLVHVVQK
jgi:hypothetical protein